MADESDGIEEALGGAVRLAVTAGARLGSEIARTHQERLRDQRRLDEREADRLAQRFEAEKRAAVAELSQVHRADWWERADAERIGQTYATARAWASEADDAARAEHVMHEQLRERYGIDFDRTDPRAVSAEVEVWRLRLEQQRRAESDRERASEATERAEAAVLVNQAVREDRDADAAREDEALADVQASKTADQDVDNPRLGGAQGLERVEEQLHVRTEQDQQRAHGGQARTDHAAGDPAPLYDSADRRAADVRTMEAQGIEPEVAQSRMRADTAAAAPATFATASARRDRVPKARKVVGRVAQIEPVGVDR